jgi:hypothetical protein
MRGLILNGWNLRELAGAVGSIAGFALFTWTLTLWALRSRTR